MRLRVVGYYHSGDVTYQAGQIIDIDSDTVEWLLRDANGLIERIPEPTVVNVEAIEAPPHDRMVRRGRRRKI